jgi:hypothetical protein
MRVAQSVAEILSKHVVLEVEGIDRMYLNVYVPRLQIIEGVLGFMKNHLGHKVASTKLVEPITRRFVAAIVSASLKRIHFRRFGVGHLARRRVRNTPVHWLLRKDKQS